jgi:tRNA-specific adenosine deaminase 3
VDPTTDEIVAVAGDARFHCPKGKSWGNPLDHAVMRAIGMVAQKRLPSDVKVAPDNPLQALNAVEGKYFGKEGEDDDGGYLCHNMHVYLSHEPCTMCAMALLHSRVGAVVFAERMRKTGALVAEVDTERGGMGLGLFWRPELNWKFLCWRWEDESVGEILDIGEGVSV